MRAKKPTTSEVHAAIEEKIFGQAPRTGMILGDEERKGLGERMAG